MKSLLGFFVLLLSESAVVAYGQLKKAENSLPKTFCEDVAKRVPKKFEFNYEELTTIANIVEKFAKETKTSLIVDRNITGKVKVFKSNASEICESFLETLKIVNLSVVPMKEGYVVSKIRNAVKNHLPTYYSLDEVPSTAQLLRVVVKIKHADVFELKTKLGSLLSSGGVLVDPAQNMIIVTNSGNNILNIKKIIQKLDQPCDNLCKQRVESFNRRENKNT